jgi:hypothetical protein
MKIKDIKNYKVQTKLEKAVKKIILNHVYKGYVCGFFEDLLNNGCVSGMVGELIYYHDTVKFYKKHKEDITTLLYEFLDNCSISCPAEIFGSCWDKEDPLALEQTNQNLLVWFAFEETARNIAYDLGLEL